MAPCDSVGALPPIGGLEYESSVRFDAARRLRRNSQIPCIGAQLIRNLFAATPMVTWSASSRDRCGWPPEMLRGRVVANLFTIPSGRFHQGRLAKQPKLFGRSVRSSLDAAYSTLRSRPHYADWLPVPSWCGATSASDRHRLGSLSETI